MQRKPSGHYVKPNHSTRVPKRWLFFHVSTERVPVAGSTNTFGLTFSGSSMLYSLTSPPGSMAVSVCFPTDGPDLWQQVYSHASKRDSLVLCGIDIAPQLAAAGFWDEVDAGRLRFKGKRGKLVGTKAERRNEQDGYFVGADPPIFGTLLSDAGRIKLLDLRNYGIGCIEELADMIGECRPSDERLELGDYEPYLASRKACDVLMKAVRSITESWRTCDCGVWQPTCGGLAMTSYRHIAYQKGSVQCGRQVVIDPNEECIEMERHAYFGGEVNTWWHGTAITPQLAMEGPCVIPEDQSGRVVNGIYHLDVSGLYACIMARGHLPRRRLFVRDRCKVKDISEALLRGLGVLACVRVHADMRPYPVRINGNQVHALGDYWTILCGAELEDALMAGDIVAADWMCAYELAPYLQEFATHWWAVRTDAKRKGDKLLAHFAKSILLAMAGRWAMRGSRWEDRPNVPAAQPWGEWLAKVAFDGRISRFRALGGYVQELVNNPCPAYCFPAVSAFITSRGRQFMREARLLCEPGSVWHQATDSLIGDERMLSALTYSRLVGDDELGKFRVVGGHQSAEIRGPNYHRLDDVWTRAGWWGRRYQLQDGQWVADAREPLSIALSDDPRRPSVISQIRLGIDYKSHKRNVLPDGTVAIPVVRYCDDTSRLSMIRTGMHLEEGE